MQQVTSHYKSLLFMVPVRTLLMTTLLGLLLAGCADTHDVGGIDEAAAIQQAKETCPNGYDNLGSHSNSDGNWIMKIRCSG
ncbi:hypothetical protein [Paraburkholderia bannensis]|uniref:hypothetical protein n=1 Tax=Paraburkholderia bannensis TaxID=765414 RepID=UPI002AB7EB70|nr:hypothetical protein [Paraburkholderia bannensis]